MGVRLLSIGAYVPHKVLTNYDLEKMVDTSDEWIVERTGIRERRIASEYEATSDLAFNAAKRAIDKAQIDPNEIDLFIVSTASPDMLFPATACILESKLGVKGKPCFDMEAACPGFIYGLEIARGLLTTGSYKKILVVGAETLSRLVDWTDRNTCVLFGDGAGAAILVNEPDNDRGIIASYLGGDGNLGDLLYFPAGGSRLPASQETVKRRLHYIKMEGREVFKHAVLSMQESALKVLEKAGMSAKDIDWLVPHQANLRIIKATAERLGIEDKKVYVNIDRYGNTSAASIPIALAEMEEKGLLKPGQKVLIVSFGAGFIWGAMLLNW